MMDTIEHIIELAIQIQQIAAPTFHEEDRGKFVQKLFLTEGLRNVATDEAGNVFGQFKSGNEYSNKKPLIVSAHMDTVFPLEMDLSIRREGDKVFGIGIGDNSLGVAALFGLIWMLKEKRTQPIGELWFVANTGEEGLGDLHGMKSVVERFGSNVLAYLVLEGMALGHVYHKAVGVKRYRITARTQGGHSWSDYGRPSAVLELTRLIGQLTSLKLPSQPRTTLNVGKINGGTSINVIPADAWMELDLRSEGPDELADLVWRVDQLIGNLSSPEVQIETSVIGERPVGEISVNHPLVRLAEACLKEQGLDAVMTSGSTDANVPLSKGYPSLVLGVSTGGGAHTKNEFIQTAPIRLGMGQLVRFVERVLE